MALPDRTDPRSGRAAVVVPEAGLAPLPASLWDGEEVREAVRGGSPGAVVALARKAHGLRQDELGALAGFSQSAISRLESGSNIAYDMRVLRTLQRLLGIPAHLLGLAERTVPVHSEQLRRLAPAFPALGQDVVVGVEASALTALCAATVQGAVARSGACTDDAVSRLLVLRRIVNDAHNWRGSAALMAAARSTYDFVDVLRRSSRGRQRRALLAVAAMYAEFYGWLHEETGDMRGAVEWTTRGLEQGQAADDRDVVAYSYVRMAQLAEADGDADRVIGLTRAARRERGLSPHVRALALREEARGMAMAGDEACIGLLDHAQDLVAGGQAPSDEEYWIGYCFTEQQVEMERASCWLELGHPVRAIAAYEDLQRRWWKRSCRWEQGLHTAKLAYAHALAGNEDQAVACGYDALEAARDSGSALVLSELGRLGAWAGAADAAELARRLR